MTEKIPVSKLVDDTDPGGKARIIEKALELETGLKLTAWLAGLFGLGVIAAVVVTLSSKPNMADLRAALGAQVTLADYNAAKQAWFDNAKDLLNVFVQPILTIMASVVGFTVGANKSR